MTNKKNTIRTSPTVSRLSYDIFNEYNIPLSNFIERGAMKIVSSDETLQNELWAEIKVKEELIKSYKQSMNVLAKKINKLEVEVEELKGNLNNNFKEKIAKDIEKAVLKFTKIINEEQSKLEQSEQENRRYNVKKISEDRAWEICELYGVTPRMVLPLIESKRYRRYFDKKCDKFLK